MRNDGLPLARLAAIGLAATLGGIALAAEGPGGAVTIVVNGDASGVGRAKAPASHGWRDADGNPREPTAEERRAAGNAAVDAREETGGRAPAAAEVTVERHSDGSADALVPDEATSELHATVALDGTKSFRCVTAGERPHPLGQVVVADGR
jgi:hypothetical protein